MPVAVPAAPAVPPFSAAAVAAVAQKQQQLQQQQQLRERSRSPVLMLSLAFCKARVVYCNARDGAKGLETPKTRSGASSRGSRPRVLREEAQSPRAASKQEASPRQASLFRPLDDAAPDPRRPVELGAGRTDLNLGIFTR